MGDIAVPIKETAVVTEVVRTIEAVCAYVISIRAMSALMPEPRQASSLPACCHACRNTKRSSAPTPNDRNIAREQQCDCDYY